MKITVVGSGALGSFYGAKLAQSGLEVHFLLRSDYDFVRQHGLTVRSIDGDFHLLPRCAAVPAEIGPSDLVVIGLKTTANHQFPSLLPPLIHPQTLILTLQNGLGNEEDLARYFDASNLLGGLCFVCLNRTAPGVIHHIGYGQIVLGEFRRRPVTRTHAVADLFRRSGIACEVAHDLERAHWEKLVWNIPFNGLGVASSAGFDAVVTGHCDPTLSLGPCLTTDRLLADARWHRLVRELMREVILTAQHLGFPVSSDLADTQIARTLEMGAYKPSTLVDFERGQPLELQSLFLNPLRTAEAIGVSVPHLAALCRILQEIDPA